MSYLKFPSNFVLFVEAFSPLCDVEADLEKSSKAVLPNISIEAGHEF
jgi:hypothetical protein